MRRMSPCAALALLLVTGCSPAGVREWAANLQTQAATGLADQQAANDLKNWQSIGVSGGTYNPRGEAEARAAAEKAASPKIEETPIPAPPPSVVYMIPAR